MRLPDINPVLVHLGPVQIHWYAIAYIAGIVCGWLYVSRLLRRDELWTPRTPPISTEQLDDLIIWIMLGIILGGRIGYIIAYDTSIIWQHPLQIFQIWQGGMSFHGGFIGVGTAAILYARAKKLDLARILNLGDALACAAPIGLFFGRLANFVNGELWGRPTTLPWGMDFCNRYIKLQYGGVCPADFDPLTGGYHVILRHPSQLYEALGEGVILFTLMWLLIHRFGKLKAPGFVMGTFIAGYGLIRILLENVRNPDAQMPDFLRHWITMGMILSIPMVLAGGFLIWNARRIAAKAA
ncbi:prolipoprotein diacylglyceryl transferase [Asticcacaulis sp. EMRT-3]|uniref:prolipoprotein diacylglyceryl transferase n=1 Tax=Asticcacaulis sp. EMRT-3 TaxID=3040349 RepID=UPI0024AECB6C|nr:prolipoprotein diacylglyceryl transferase [Asticcacaulis sp. EMRT-3]MDI7774873.1 prolipoprotein diacylglyceryl transferase [Asticcacaulis sp. EMRT-3]